MGRSQALPVLLFLSYCVPKALHANVHCVYAYVYREKEVKKRGQGSQEALECFIKRGQCGLGSMHL